MKKWFGPWSAARSRDGRLSAGTLGVENPNPEPWAFALLCTEQPTRRELMPGPCRARSIGVLASHPRPLALPRTGAASWFDSENAVVSDGLQVGERLCSSRCYD